MQTFSNMNMRLMARDHFLLYQLAKAVIVVAVYMRLQILCIIQEPKVDAVLAILILKVVNNVA